VEAISPVVTRITYPVVVEIANTISGHYGPFSKRAAAMVLEQYGVRQHWNALGITYSLI
jgi:hypothetical protein